MFITPLESAIQRGNVEVIKVLLEASLTTNPRGLAITLIWNLIRMAGYAYLAIGAFAPRCLAVELTLFAFEVLKCALAQLAFTGRVSTPVSRDSAGHIAAHGFRLLDRPSPSLRAGKRQHIP